MAGSKAQTLNIKMIRWELFSFHLTGALIFRSVFSLQMRRGNWKDFLAVKLQREENLVERAVAPRRRTKEAAAFPRITALHGDADPAVRIQPTRDSVKDLQDHGYNVELVEYSDVGHQITPEMHRKMTELLSTAIQETSNTQKGQ